MFDHNDALNKLNSSLTLKEKLVAAHDTLRNKFPFIARIAITLYDSETKVLKTFLHSSGDDNPLEHYEALLNQATSLKEILKQGKPRVVNNLITFDNSTAEHAKRIGRQGYAASYTMPMFQQGEFIGFLFFNSYEKDVFTEKVLTDLDIFGHLISLLVINEISNIKIMSAAIKTSSQMAHIRDPETGSHLDRMSRYSRLIAKKLAVKYQLDDDYIEHIFMFSPLHDIGKIAVPDKILQKPGKLTEDETKQMQQHARKGREMIDNMIRNFDLSDFKNIEILRNIAEFHHETVNGNGYPEGRIGDEIPLEARIVAVADVFDALTTKRCYKTAWTNDKAFAFLTSIADLTLDRDCVDALLSCQEEIKIIQQQFRENIYG